MTSNLLFVPSPSLVSPNWYWKRRAFEIVPEYEVHGTAIASEPYTADAPPRHDFDPFYKHVGNVCEIGQSSHVARDITATVDEHECPDSTKAAQVCRQNASIAALIRGARMAGYQLGNWLRVASIVTLPDD